jgi:nucleoside-diphosphate-sugar epimerase
MMGPPSPRTGITKFLKWLENALARDEALDLFSDEIRSFVSVHDVCRSVVELMRLWGGPGSVWHGTRLFNMGGPDALSRVGLAEELARANTALSLRLSDGGEKLRPTCRSLLDGKIGYASPLDITMNSVDLEATVGFAFRPMREVIREVMATVKCIPATPAPENPGAKALSFLDALLLAFGCYHLVLKPLLTLPVGSRA